MSPGSTQPPAAGELSRLALDKLTRVLGEAQGRRAYALALAEAQLADVRTPDDLHALGTQLSRRGGMEAAVGGLLMVAAVMRGATPPGR